MADFEEDKRDEERRDKLKEKAEKADTERDAGGGYDFAGQLNRTRQNSLLEKEKQQEQARREQRVQEFRRFQRNESQEIVNDFENPRERAARYQSMDKWQADIAAERARRNESQAQEQRQHEMPPKDKGTEREL